MRTLDLAVEDQRKKGRQEMQRKLQMEGESDCHPGEVNQDIFRCWTSCLSGTMHKLGCKW